MKEGNKTFLRRVCNRMMFDFSVPFAAERGGGDFWATKRAHGLARAEYLRHYGDSASGNTVGLPAEEAELSRQPLSAPHHPVQGTCKLSE